MEKDDIFYDKQNKLQESPSIQDKLSFEYEKLELQRKLNDMISTITNFKNSTEPNKAEPPKMS